MQSKVKERGGRGTKNRCDKQNTSNTVDLNPIISIIILNVHGLLGAENPDNQSCEICIESKRTLVLSKGLISIT